MQILHSTSGRISLKSIRITETNYCYKLKTNTFSMDWLRKKENNVPVVNKNTRWKQLSKHSHQSKGITPNGLWLYLLYSVSISFLFFIIFPISSFLHIMYMLAYLFIYNYNRCLAPLLLPPLLLSLLLPPAQSSSEVSSLSRSVKRRFLPTFRGVGRFLFMLVVYVE